MRTGRTGALCRRTAPRTSARRPRASGHRTTVHVRLPTPLSSKQHRGPAGHSRLADSSSGGQMPREPRGAGWAGHTPDLEASHAVRRSQRRRPDRVARAAPNWRPIASPRQRGAATCCRLAGLPGRCLRPAQPLGPQPRSAPAPCRGRCPSWPMTTAFRGQGLGPTRPWSATLPGVRRRSPPPRV